MNLERVLSIVGAMVTVALVTTVVTRGGQASLVINAIGTSFSNMLRTAMGGT